MWILVFACAGSASDADSGHDIPGHSDCLAIGEAVDEETCRAVVDHDGRLPTVSELSSGEPLAGPTDPRITDPDYRWLTTEIERCTCVCCHTTSLGGPGVFRYDLEFAPVWIDSASDWVLSVLVGDTEDPLRTLPTADPERLRSVVEREWERRGGY